MVASGVTFVVCVAGVGVVSVVIFGVLLLSVISVPVASVLVVGFGGVAVSVVVAVVSFVVWVPSPISDPVAALVSVIVVWFSLGFGCTTFPFFPACPASLFVCFPAAPTFGLAMFALLGATLLWDRSCALFVSSFALFLCGVPSQVSFFVAVVVSAVSFSMFARFVRFALRRSLSCDL